MTTNELIKMLKEEDPSGKLHVRVAGGFPIFAEKKEGYWDGPYSYQMPDGRVMITTKGEKVDLVAMDPEDVIYNNDGDYSKIEFDFSGYDGQARKKKEQEYLERFEKISKDVKRQDDQMNSEALSKILHKIKEGWKIYQDKDTPVGQYHRMYLKKGIHKDRLCQGECGVLLKSGFFYHKEGEWIFDPKEGEKYL